MNKTGEIFAKVRPYRDNNFMSKKHRKVQVVISALCPGEQNEFLLLQTNQRRGEFWQNVTGSVEENEDWEAAAFREAQEETGFVVENFVELISLKIDFEFTDQWKKEVKEKCYLLLLDQKWKPKLDPSEHQNSRWLKASELNENVVKFPSNYSALQTAQKWIEERFL